MYLPVCCNVLKEGTSGGLVLAADFPATGRSVAGFSDLVPKLQLEHTVWETGAPPAGSDVAVPAGDHLDRWLSDVRASGLVVRTVLGYCVGSVYAAALVDRIARWQPEPARVVVFDPERPDPALLRRHYQELIGGLASVLSAEEIGAAQRSGERAWARADGMRQLASELCELCCTIGGTAFERAGLDPDRSAELTGTFRSFIGYLVAAAEIDPTRVWATATALSSATPHNGLNVLAQQDRAGIVSREIRFDLPHSDLLRNADVIRTVDELLR